MHPAAYSWIESHVPLLRERYPYARILEVGSLEVNGEIRPLFPWAKEYTGLDQVAGPGVDIVADATKWDYPASEFDIVISTEMFEHCREWWMVIAGARKTLKPGGALLVTCAGPDRRQHGQHGAPDPAEGEWYENIVPDDLLLLLWQKWHDVTVNVLAADVRCLAFKPI